jgi:hypothetical protein
MGLAGNRKVAKRSTMLGGLTSTEDGGEAPLPDVAETH